MRSPEILLLLGMPGAGASSIADRFVELGLVDGVRHFDMRKAKRSMEEFILEHPPWLTIVSGFSCRLDQVHTFQESIAQINVTVLALCVVEANSETLLQHLERRAVRSGQKIKDPRKRLKDHFDSIVPTIERLAQDYPHYTLNGARSLDMNARLLLDIYTYRHYFEG